MTPPKRQGRVVAGLSRDQVLDAAMDVVVTEGVERLTVRGLAAKLGVAVTAIYWHVGDKQALLDGLVDRIIDTLGQVSVRGTGPEQRLLSIGRSLRRSLLAEPDLVALVHRQGRTAALFQPARRVLVRELVAAGLEGPAVARALQAIVNLVVGSVLLDRQVERQPMQRAEAVALWTPGDVPPEPPGLLEELRTPVDEEAVFTYSMRALVRAVLEGTA